MKPIYAIKDRALDNYGETLTLPSEQHAKRWFRDLANSDPEKSTIAKHPDDFDLYQIGDYHDERGVINPYEMPQLIARAKDLINPKE